MHDTDTKTDIRYEFASRPNTGDAMAVATGLHWLRMPLPFSLGHINLWLLEDDGGWTIVDTGVAVDDGKKVWEKTFAGTMDSRPLKRIIVTHLHPDHAGCAGWLAAKYSAPLWMTREEYLLCRVLVADTGRAAPNAGTDFYHAAGFATNQLHRYQEMFGMFGRYVTALPESYHRLRDGQIVTIGSVDWEVIVGRGHSPEHACLFSAEQNLLISGDQLLPTISSNVSVYPTEPAANPLEEWLESLAILKARIPSDVLVLPAHGRPFRGAHGRLDGLISEHARCLDELEKMCARPRRAVDTFEVLFRSEVTDQKLIMATGESVAHLNYLLGQGRIEVEVDRDGIRWYQTR